MTTTAAQETFLRQNLQRYSYADKAKLDIKSALIQYPDLRPKLENFTFNNGETRQLMALDGTIPVTYQGQIYNIPICAYLVEDHPYNPPIVFVRPTSTMQVKPGQHVDNNGKIYLPYLHEWRFPQSDLIGLIGIMRIHFSEQPPVFARQANSAQRVGGTPYPSGGTPYPQYPGMPTPQMPPAYPMAAGGGWSGYGTGSAWGSQSQPTAGYPPATNPSAGSSVAPGLSEDHVIMSLRSAVEDKLRRKLSEQVAQHQAELEALRGTEKELQRGKSNLEEMITKIDLEKTKLTTVLTELQSKNAECNESLRRATDEDTVNVDAAVDTTAPLYRQLVFAYAEEQAIEDALYYLLEGRRKNVIDCDEFLKNVRDLSRKQFMLRATVSKCREKAGLPEQ